MFTLPMIYKIWPKFPRRNFIFGAGNIVKNSDEEKYVYSGYGIAFDGKGE